MDDPVRTLTRLDDALREYRTQEEDDYRYDDGAEDEAFWDGYNEARRIVGQHLKAARVERGH